MGEHGRMDPFSFAGSDELNYPVSIRIINLEGEEVPVKISTLFDHPHLRHIGSNTSLYSDLYITVQIWAGSKPLTIPVQTAYKPFRTERKWNEWLRLPILYQDLPRNACIAITLWDLFPSRSDCVSGHAVPFGGATLPLFDKDNQLRKGRQKCSIHRHRLADGKDDSATPAFGRTQTNNSLTNTAYQLHDRSTGELERMEGLLKKHEMGELPRIEWLDQIVFRRFEKRGLHAAKTSLEMRQRRRAVDGAEKSNEATGAASSTGINIQVSLYTLNVELPRFDFPIVYADQEYDAPPVSAMQPTLTIQADSQFELPEVHYGPGIYVADSSLGSYSAGVGRVYDPEIGHKDNPAETKHRRLFRSSHRHGILDKDLKPNAKVRDELNLIMTYPPTQILSSEETDLVWKFRYHLTRDKRASTKFVKSVNWRDQSESRQAIQVLSRWTEIEVDDALELLGPSFDNPAVRTYAVDRLRKADDNEILLYLLQLVQALKHEHVPQGYAQDAKNRSPLAQFLIQRAAANFMLGNYFYWYLMVESDDKSPEQGSDNRSIFRQVSYDFMVELVKQPTGHEDRKTLLRQGELLATLTRLATEVKISGESMSKKQDRVKTFLADPTHELLTIDPPLAMPLDPSIYITGIVSDQATVFKSSLSPIKCAFKTTSGNIYPIIFKVGDDLRQDQLVIQIITLMDQLLQKENLDLKLVPYKILATSTTTGASQFIQSQSLSSIVSKFRTNPALAYLRHHNPDETQALGVRAETLDIYVRSCAGYCVITYILGVGDRHLDNLLLAPDGHFFHADFGYILGRDPKPFAPVMKLSKEMVDCMGGIQSEHYQRFRQYCFLAYTALRKSSNLILNLFSLMVDANIPDIRIEPDKAVLKVRERFHLEMNEEEAILYFGRVIDDNLTAFAPVVIDKLHEWAQAFRV